MRIRFHTLAFLHAAIATVADHSCHSPPASSNAQHQEQAESNGCTALVVYDEKSRFPLEAFAQKSKVVQIGGREYKLRQSWASIGVAGVVWDAAIVLSEYLAEKPALVEGKRILELGAGTGLPSIVSANLGALSVTATDLPSSLPLLKRNVASNLEPVQYSRVEVRELVWSRASVVELMSQIPFGAYDLVIGADVVYNEEVFSDLLETLLAVVELSKRRNISTQVILSMRLRYDRDRNFLKMLKSVYVVVDEIYFDVMRDIHIYLCGRTL